jgi:hypothetical protein
MGILHGAEMTLSYILHSVFRLIQIIMALAVCGLYGVDLNKADKEHKYSDGKWVRLSSLSIHLPPPHSHPHHRHHTQQGSFADAQTRSSQK